MEEANKKRSELIVSIFPVVGRSNILTQWKLYAYRELPKPEWNGENHQHLFLKYWHNEYSIYLLKKKKKWLGEKLKRIFIVKQVLTPEAFLQMDIGKWKLQEYRKCLLS